MWDNTLIESKGYGRTGRRYWTVPVAALLHIAIIVVAILASYWQVEAMESPLARITYDSPIPVDLGPPPEPGGGPTTPPEANERPQPEPSTEPELTQPTTVPETIATGESEAVESTEFAEGTDPFAPPGPGRPDGVDGGDPDSQWGQFNRGTGGDQEPMIITHEITQPVLIHRVEPPYPAIAARLGIEGVVILEAVITKTGSVEQVKTLRSDHSLLETAARNAVLQWRYRPALLNNNPVKVYFTVTVRFQLK